MTVSIIIISVNLGKAVPMILESEEGEVFAWTRGKIAMVVIGVLYFSIILSVIFTPVKPTVMHENSSDTLEVTQILTLSFLDGRIRRY